MVGRIILIVIVVLVVLFGAIQLVPYGRDHTNPPVKQDTPWSDAATKQLAVQACYDCHSNQTIWPWYSKVAPVSWLLERDVKKGRQVLNFSEWPQPQGFAGPTAEVINQGEMPPWNYRLIHSGARLSAAQKQQLVTGMQATLK